MQVRISWHGFLNVILIVHMTINALNLEVAVKRNEGITLSRALLT